MVLITAAAEMDLSTTLGAIWTSSEPEQEPLQVLVPEQRWVRAAAHCRAEHGFPPGGRLP